MFFCTFVVASVACRVVCCVSLCVLLHANLWRVCSVQQRRCIHRIYKSLHVCPGSSTSEHPADEALLEGSTAQQACCLMQQRSATVLQCSTQRCSTDSALQNMASPITTNHSLQLKHTDAALNGIATLSKAWIHSWSAPSGASKGRRTRRGHG
ncbi:hypothetical protein JKP88DRAFT_230138 [Tribonema minus]|uniref:Secreted protein n=1 Tax=Tribonema minus TaxID=303371 RepID=A0A836CQW9_9STRA|nr:hypothetical protein JKP88DRAFT_230138 [Tribonema minus]